MRFLIAEDDFGSRKLLQAFLKKIPDIDVDLVVDGKEALEAVKLAWQENAPYQVIFMDIMMPVMDGQDALRAVREVEKDMGVLPRDEVKVIMVTALEDPGNVIQAYNKGGATGYLVKPITYESLIQELKNIGVV